MSKNRVKSSKSGTTEAKGIDEADVLLQELEAIEEKKNRNGEISSKLRDILQNEKEAVKDFNNMRKQEKAGAAETGEKADNQAEAAEHESSTPVKENGQESGEAADREAAGETREPDASKEDRKVVSDLADKEDDIETSWLNDADELDYLDDEKDYDDAVHRDEGQEENEDVLNDDIKEESEADKEDFLASLDKRTEKIVHERLRKAEPKRLTTKRNVNRDEGIFVNNLRELATGHIHNIVVLISMAALAILLVAALILDRKNIVKEQEAANECFLQIEDAGFKKLVTDYYKALEDGKPEVAKALVEETSAVDEKHFQNRVDEVKMYKANIFDTFRVTDCLVQPGLKEKEYIVYCQYEIDIKEVETPAPGLLTFYVTDKSKDEQKTDYRIVINDKGSERYQYMIEKSECKEVKELLEETNQELEKACKKDENLKKVIDALKTFD